HQPERHDAVAEGMAGRAQHRESGHVGAEERREEHVRTDRASREKVLLRVLASATVPEGEDADVEDRREIDEDDENREHGDLRKRGTRRRIPTLSPPDAWARRRGRATTSDRRTPARRA